MRALIKRINRKLPDEVLTTARWRDVGHVGQYFTFNPERNWVVRTSVDPEGLARELGVLADYEQVVE